MGDLSGRPFAIELRSLCKRFGDQVAVDGLDLAVPRGATYGLLGPNGAGKTTTIRIILRILEPDRGEVRVLGTSQRQEVLDHVGYLPEERGLYRRMKVLDLLTFFAALKGQRSAESRAPALAWLERLGLADRRDVRVQDLSKGMQQKLQFIVAVLHEPEIVILDEPFAGLDPINQRVLREVIAEIQRSGRTILFSTHLIEHAERLCDHVCIIARGRKVADGPIGRLKRDHGGAYVALGLDGGDRGDHAGVLETIRTSPLVARATADGSEIEVALGDNARTDEFLAWLVGRGIRLRRFELVEPSLQQIFIDRVGEPPALEEASSA